MLYKSLNKISKKVNFETAVKNGLAGDGGLYFPENIKPLGNNFYQKIIKKSNFNLLIKNSINEFFPEVSGRSKTRKLKKSVSGDTIEFAGEKMRILLLKSK